MVERVIFQGRTYRRYPDSKRRNNRVYFQCSSRTKKHRYLHQSIWESVNGEIPEGSAIHHKDHNPLNNSSENLVCITRGKHQSHHVLEKFEDEEYRKRNKKYMAELWKKGVWWHKTEAGKKQHKEQAKYLHQKRQFICTVCKKEYVAQVMGRNKYCSIRCRSKIYNKKYYQVIRQCVICNTEFQTNSYWGGITCSSKCTGK